jgi:hypothetical protein
MSSRKEELVKKGGIVNVSEPSIGSGTVKDGQDGRIGRLGLSTVSTALKNLVSWAWCTYMNEGEIFEFDTRVVRREQLHSSRIRQTRPVHSRSH